MATSPGPFRAMLRRDGVYIVVSDDQHTVCEVRACDDDTHPGRAADDVELITRALCTMSDMTPSVGRIVHYVSYGTPGGEYASVCRAAVITEVCDSKWTCDKGDGCACLCVLNPTGQFFNTHVAYHPGATVDTYTGQHKPGTWHWPERVE